MLSNAIQSFYDAEGLTDADIRIRKRVGKELKVLLRPSDPNIKLHIFGSSANGFGMKDSDVDLCLTSSMNLNEIESILKVRKDAISSIMFIPSAKVPIIKYRHRGTDLMVDLSMKTAISSHGTKLLKAYTEIDPRVSILGCFLKKMAKSVDICDPSKRSLSSFAYSLMLIHFLQQHPQPVLPVLTQLAKDAYTSHWMDSVDIETWPQYGKNKESLRRLWLGFLKFYSNFDFEHNVISIKQIETLKKDNHDNWADLDGIVIQSPFEAEENVARHLFKEMSDHIILTIRRWNKYFRGTFCNLRSAQDIFNDHEITFAVTPINRTCGECGNRGHRSINCPYRSYSDSD